MRKTSALIIGSFQSTENGYIGKLDTLAIKADIQIVRINDKEKDNHPDYYVSSNGKDIGVAYHLVGDQLGTRRHCERGLAQAESVSAAEISSRLPTKYSSAR